MSTKNQYNLTKQKVRTLKDIAYDAISKNIISGDIPVGTRLIETALSKQLGISRGPVREALALLEQDGFITSTPNKGAVVTELSSPEVDEVFIPIRTILERFTFLKALEILGQSDFEQLEKTIEGMDRAYRDKDMKAVTKFDYEFHRYVISRCASSTLKSIWYSLTARITRRIYSQTQVNELAENVVKQHRDLLDSIKTSNRIKLCELLEEHFI